MDTYLIEADSVGGYQVRVVSPHGELGAIVAQYPTRSEAQRWIDDQTRLAMRSANASDVA